MAGDCPTEQPVGQTLPNRSGGHLSQEFLQRHHGVRHSRPGLCGPDHQRSKIRQPGPAPGVRRGAPAPLKVPPRRGAAAGETTGPGQGSFPSDRPGQDTKRNRAPRPSGPSRATAFQFDAESFRSASRPITADLTDSNAIQRTLLPVGVVLA